MILKFKKLEEDAQIPEAAHPGDAGIDLTACICEREALGGGTIREALLCPGARLLVPTGLACELPAGTELQIRPRSGLAIKHGITVLNTPGTVDEGYRGEIGVILFNTSDEVFHIRHGMKIAQACLKRVETFDIEEVAELSDTARGEGGFGSTGYTQGG